MPRSQFPLPRRHPNVYDSRSHNQQSIQPPLPPGPPSPPVRPPAPPPMHLPLQALPPFQPQPTPTPRKPKFRAMTCTGRDHLGHDARHAQRHTQLGPLPFYPRLGYNERASQQALSFPGPMCYHHLPRNSNIPRSNANTIQLRGMPQHPGIQLRGMPQHPGIQVCGMPQHPGRRMLATEANSIQPLSRQTRRGAFFQRQVQRRAEIERLTAERLQRDMEDGASDEKRYWKGGVQNLARKEEISDMQELEQLVSELRLSCERVWKWLESVTD